MNDLIKVDYNKEEPTVSARELHQFLEIGTKYADWFNRMKEYGFTEGTDFLLVAQKRETNNPKNSFTEYMDHQLTPCERLDAPWCEWSVAVGQRRIVP